MDDPFARYRSGDWVAVVGEGALVLLEPGSGPAMVDDVRGALRDGATSVLQVLARHAPGGLADLPPFALLTRIDGAVHVVVRGAGVRVDVLAADGTRTVTGEDAATWVEKSFAGADEVVVGTTSSDGAAAAGRTEAGADPWWPIGQGVVLVHELRSSLVEPTWSGPGVTSQTGTRGAEDLVAETVVSRGTRGRAAAGGPGDAGPGADPVEPATAGANPPAADAVQEGAAVAVGDAAAPGGAAPAEGGASAHDVVPAMRTPDSVDVTILPPEDPPFEGDGLGVTLASATTSGPEGLVERGGEDPDPRLDDVDAEYDYLWGSTVLHPVEAAAVREDEDEDDGHGAPAPASAPVGPEPSGAPAATATTSGSGVAAGPAGIGPAGSGSDAAVAAPNAPASRVPASDGSPPAATAAPAVPGSPAAAGAPAAPGAPRAPAAPGASATHQPSAAPWSPPFLIDAPLATPGSRGVVRVSTGAVLTLDRPVVVGRKPRVSRVASGAVPHLVTVPSPANDISRSHVEIRLEEAHVLVVDLGSTNGSTLLRPGREPQRLHPHEAMLVLSGDVVDLGEDVTLTFEGLA